MPAHKNLKFIKRIMICLAFSSFLISLSIPVYAPFNIGPGLPGAIIDYRPLMPVADVSMDYQDFEIRSITGSGFGGSVEGQRQKTIVIDCIGYGIASITWTTSGSVGNFVQQFSINIVISDDFIMGDTFGVSGRSNLTIFTTEGRVTFKGIIYGNATFSDVGTLDIHELQLSFVGTSSLGLVISLNMQGILTFFDWDLVMTSDGVVLSFSRFPGNF